MGLGGAPEDSDDVDLVTTRVPAIKLHLVTEALDEVSELLLQEVTLDREVDTVKEVTVHLLELVLDDNFALLVDVEVGAEVVLENVGTVAALLSPFRDLLLGVPDDHRVKELLNIGFLFLLLPVLGVLLELLSLASSNSHLAHLVNEVLGGGRSRSHDFGSLYE